ncbi:hypothetical protein [Phenylobacterium deserti]|nr:hypothetical protein [Phenylobacterium deserti]
MPRPVLQLVAGLLGLLAAAAFALGVINAPHRGRLPGEKPDSAASAGAAIEAEEATPLSTERIEGPPPPPELTPEEKAKLEAEAKAKEEAEAARRAEQAASAPASPTPTTPAQPVQPPADRVGDLLDGVTPPPADPPF